MTVCPFCGTGCNFYLQSIDNELSGIAPCKTDPVSKGELCIKGRNAWEFVQNPDRLKKPLVRKDGKLVETSWEEAYKTIADKINTIKKEHGSESLGLLSSAKCTNEDNYLMMKFARSVLETNNIDHCARL